MRRSARIMALGLAGAAFALPAAAASAQPNDPAWTGQAVMTGRAIGANTTFSDSDFAGSVIPSRYAALHVGLVRYPGGSLSDTFNYSSPSSTTNFNNFVTLLSNTGALEAPITPAGQITVDYGTASVGPTVAAQWIANAQTLPNYSDATWVWEIGNENYGPWETDTHPNPHTAQSYATNALPYFQAMHAVDPNAKLGFPYALTIPQCGGCGGWIADPTAWNNTVLAADGPQIGFAEVHWYPEFGDPIVSNAQLFSTLNKIPPVMQTARDSLDRYAPGAGIVVGETNVAQAEIVYNAWPIAALYSAATSLKFLSHGAISYDWWQTHNSDSLEGDFGFLSNGSGTAGQGTATLTAPVGAGAVNLPVSSSTNFFYAHSVTIDAGANQESRKVTSVPGSTTLAAAASPGDTNIKLVNPSPYTGSGVQTAPQPHFAAGTPITVDSGANQETRTIVAAGSQASNTTLAAAAHAGDTVVHIEGQNLGSQGFPIFTGPGFVPGATVTIGSGADQETDTIKSVGDWDVGATSSQTTTTVAPVQPGDSTVYVNNVANTNTGIANYVGDPITIDTGTNQEVGTIAAVGVNAGTATTLAAPTNAGDTIVFPASISGMTAGHPLLLDVGTANYEKATITNVGTAAGAATTTVAPTSVGDTLVYPASISGMVAGDNLVIDTGATFERAKIASVGTAAGAATTLVAPTAVGDTVVYPASVTGMTAGHYLVLDTGTNFERAQIATVGTAAGAATTTVAPSAAGDHTLYVASITGFTAGHKLVVDTGTGLETDTINAVGTAASTATTLAAAATAGSNNVKVTSVTGLTAGHGIVIDTGTNLEVATIATVGTAGATGTGVTLTAGLAKSHNSGVSARDEGTGITLTAALANAHAAGAGTRDEGTGVTLSTPLTIAHASGASIRDEGTGVTLATALTIAHAQGVSTRDQGTGVTVATPLQFAHASGAATRDAGTGITLTQPLTLAHASGVTTQDAGPGVTLTTPLQFAHPSGEAFTTPGTGFTLNAPLSLAHPGGATVTSSGVTVTPALSLSHAGGAAVHDPGLQEPALDTQLPAYWGLYLASMLTGPGATLTDMPSPVPTVVAYGSYLANSNQSVMLINDSDSTWTTVGLGGLPGNGSTPLTVSSYSLENPSVTTSSTTVGSAQAGGLVLPPESIQVYSDAAAGASPTSVSVSPTVPASPVATVASVLGLSIGSSTASFGTFTPGLAATYTTSVSADVVSTAAQATLSAYDASPTSTGYLVHGAYALASPLNVEATDPSQPASSFAPLGSAASPLTLLSYSAPISHDPVTISFQQAIGATDPLRTGTYGKTLTFTLSTNTP